MISIDANAEDEFLVIANRMFIVSEIGGVDVTKDDLVTCEHGWLGYISRDAFCGLDAYEGGDVV